MHNILVYVSVYTSVNQHTNQMYKNANTHNQKAKNSRKHNSRVYLWAEWPLFMGVFLSADWLWIRTKRLWALVQSYLLACTLVGFCCSQVERTAHYWSVTSQWLTFFCRMLKKKIPYMLFLKTHAFLWMALHRTVTMHHFISSFHFLLERKTTSSTSEIQMYVQMAEDSCGVNFINTLTVVNW